ncbi:MerR family transcriptional regulator [Vagococcus coleopterorum]|uniref:MerR family transcriptional regulator n=1 Tax=Vagococcus coleopterorum TaxID=2714946 RepID=A0A6G8APF7_9ENTE|nr:MerR family transcriptional regulator [Vagococcus coleopterorum]QIL46860.1 MerR family transcriptional regulator [Vagococcus coleopterorum]
MKKYTIGEIAEKYQISTDTLRYYDKENVIPFVKKDEANRRYFVETDFQYLDTIVCLKRVGIEVKEIARFMAMCLAGDRTLESRYEFIQEQESLLVEKMALLSESLDYLRWKKWYYSEATQAKTETIFFKEGTTQVDPKHYEDYLLKQENKKLTQ